MCGGVLGPSAAPGGGAGRGPAVHRGSGRGRGPGRGSPVGAGGFASGAHPAGTRRARGKRLPGGNWAGGQWKGSSPAAPRGSGAPGGTRGYPGAAGPGVQGGDPVGTATPSGQRPGQCLGRRASPPELLRVSHPHGTGRCTLTPSLSASGHKQGPAGSGCVSQGRRCPRAGVVPTSPSWKAPSDGGSPVPLRSTAQSKRASSVNIETRWKCYACSSAALVEGVGSVRSPDRGRGTRGSHWAAGRSRNGGSRPALGWLCP